MVQYGFFVRGIGDNKKVLGRHNRQETLKSAADKTLAGPQYVKELFGVVVLAQWPKAASYTTSHYYAVFVVHYLVCV